MNNAWALLIGINNYEQYMIYGNLECCVPDAIGLYILLTHPDGSGVNPDQVCLLVDGTDDYIKRTTTEILQQMQACRWLSGVVRSGIVDEIVNRQQEPTREHILHEMNRWAHTAGSDDWLLVHYSGHGDVFDGDIYLIPPRAHFSSLSDTAIPLSRMKELMRGSRAWAKVLSLDACYSGSAVGKKVPHPTTEESQRTVLSGVDEIAILTSCLPYERAIESGSLFSVFGEYLLEGLSGVADEKKQNLVTFLDLYRYVEPRVKRWAANIPDAPTQTPFLHAPGVLSHLALTGSEAAAHNAVLKGSAEYMFPPSEELSLDDLFPKRSDIKVIKEYKTKVIDKLKQLENIKDTFAEAKSRLKQYLEKLVQGREEYVRIMKEEIATLPERLKREHPEGGLAVELGIAGTVITTQDYINGNTVLLDILSKVINLCKSYDCSSKEFEAKIAELFDDALFDIE